MKKPWDPAPLSGLYYPFSRCIDAASLKQMLLVFETITFVDPVDDEGWRAKLYKDLEDTEDPRYGAYRDVASALDELFDARAVRRVDPAALKAITAHTTAAAAVTDLCDAEWVRIASDPARFGMPHRTHGPEGAPTWEAFPQKLPEGFVDVLQNHDDFRPHLVRQLGPEYAWTFSYAAGSAAALNLHLSAAQELGLAPVTDSAMHHTLLLLKIGRRSSGASDPKVLSEPIVRELTNRAAVTLVQETLPREALLRASFGEILEFREKTAELRSSFVRDVHSRLAVRTTPPDIDSLLGAAHAVENDLRDELKEYNAAIRAARDKVWPGLIKSFTAPVVAGSLAAVALSYVGHLGLVLADSIAATSFAMLKTGLDLRAERRAVEARAAPSVTYLSRVRHLP